jgi:small subunit ribosomal protein S17
MSDEAANVGGEASDDTQAVTASAPDRSTGETNGELQRASERQRAARKVREGVVVSNGMDKTAVVAVIERVRHPKYNKFVLQTKKLYAHDEANDVNVGDRVRVMEMRPLSKTKRWRVTDVLERAK